MTLTKRLLLSLPLSLMAEATQLIVPRMLKHTSVRFSVHGILSRHALAFGEHQAKSMFSFNIIAMYNITSAIVYRIICLSSHHQSKIPDWYENHRYQPFRFSRWRLVDRFLSKTTYLSYLAMPELPDGRLCQNCNCRGRLR